MVPVLAALLIGLLVGFTGGRLSRPGAQPTGVPSVANGAAESAHAAALADLRSKLAAATEQANSLQRLLDLYQRGERAKAPEPPVQAGPSLEETLRWLKTRIDFTPADPRNPNPAAEFVPTGCEPQVQYDNGRYTITIPLSSVDLSSVQVRKRDVKQLEVLDGRSGRSGTEVAGSDYYFTMSTKNKRRGFVHRYPGQVGMRDSFTMPVDNEGDGEKLVKAFVRAATLCGATKDVF